MTRPRADDYDSKKQLILDRSAALFGSRGFESTTMMEVARACGASKSHLYHYFARKEDLLFGVIREHIAGQADELAAIVALPLPAEERFERFVEAFVLRSADSRNEHLVLMHDLKFLPESERRQVRRLEKRLVDMMVGLLEAISPGAMQDVRLRTPYALMMFGMIIWTFTWYEKGGPIKPHELARRMSGLFVSGIRGAGGRTAAGT